MVEACELISEAPLPRPSPPPILGKYLGWGGFPFCGRVDLVTEHAYFSPLLFTIVLRRCIPATCLQVSAECSLNESPRGGGTGGWGMWGRRRRPRDPGTCSDDNRDDSLSNRPCALRVVSTSGLVVTRRQGTTACEPCRLARLARVFRSPPQLRAKTSISFMRPTFAPLGLLRNVLAYATLCALTGVAFCFSS